ncbi:MAG: LytTR family DNA-binding domain-containing protein [Blautia sp.]|nr:LytTR family DNA-binding domain-containing protein [Blautia sp.]
MKVAICDDEKSERRLLCKYVEEWASVREQRAETHCFESAESFLFSWEDEKDYKVLILDIEMGSMNGMDLARKIRETDRGIPILSVTGYDEYMQFGYDVTALHYLIKPVNREKFFSVLDRLPMERKEAEKLFFQMEEGSVSLSQDEIWYVEADGHRCALHTRDRVMQLKESISSVEKRLAGFETVIKCHRSYLVNLRHVSVVLKEEMVLDDHQKVPLSRNRRKAANDAFIRCYAHEQ